MFAERIYRVMFIGVFFVGKCFCVSRSTHGESKQMSEEFITVCACMVGYRGGVWMPFRESASSVVCRFVAEGERRCLVFIIANNSNNSNNAVFRNNNMLILVNIVNLLL